MRAWMKRSPRSASIAASASGRSTTPPGSLGNGGSGPPARSMEGGVGSIPGLCAPCGGRTTTALRDTPALRLDVSDPAYRILDANANRAREGLRVLEDVARFALDDQELSHGCKAARHDLTQLLAGCTSGPRDLLASRDTPGDVGAGLPDAGGMRRASLAGVVHAAGGRVGEALRCVE